MDNSDDKCVGINFKTQKLHCLVVLDDRVGQALSDIAGNAFYRAFVVEERATGEILMNQRFRYVKKDSWQQFRLTAEKRTLPKKKQIEFLAGVAEYTMRTALSLLSGANPPRDVVVLFYPPDPDDGPKTLEWLIAQDLIQITNVDGIPVSVGTDSVV